jgi:hypothetical protein
MHTEATAPARALAASDDVKQACCTFYVVRATCAEFGLQAGNMKFDNKNED